jgi:mannose-1-phosphate guanylyltransferase
MTGGQERQAGPWAIVLAGGEGTRLRALTRLVAGDERPKQFCRIVGRETLLGQTCRRVARVVPPSRTLVVLTRAHERFYAGFLADVAVRSVIQPAGRGTAAAILYALLVVQRIAPDPPVAVLPADHYVSDDAAFMAHVETALGIVRARPELAVLLGVTPTGPETGYGWIEPAGPVPLPGVTAARRVRRFWEKPPRPVAEALLERGCLWNSFVLLARASTLLAGIRVALPALFEAFATVSPCLGGASEPAAVEALYERLGSWDFSREVLARQTANLTVLPVRGVEWSDWGEPGRVLSTLARLGQRPGWVEAVPVAAG